MRHGPVYSAELLDSKSLSSVNDTTGTGLTAVLTETKGDTPEELQANIDAILSLLSPFKLYVPARFTSDPAEYSEYWKIRAGIFPSVGGTRPIGTTVLIEDVAFHIDDLPNATVELQQLLVEHGYDDACIYGHALEGNYHFIISQAFDNEADVERYRQLMEGVEHLVVDRYDGSLKAEHGTGRNMAPFVAKEWGDKAWSIMKRLKNIFDPHGILNPGVIFNDDPLCYIRGIKSMPRTNDHVDRCIECGFCEVNCVTCGHTLSARQRIAAQREISRLARTGEDTRRLAALRKQFQRLGTDTCAGDGLCSTSCPMGINTADMIHDLRSSNIPPNSLAYKIGTVAARHLNVCKAMLRPLLSAADSTHRLLGDNAVNRIGAAIHTVGIPLWTSALPSAYYPHSIDGESSVRKVVYFPSCINQTMGATGEKTSGNRPRPLIDTMVALCRKAGYEVIFPLGMGNLCCGMIWESKGMPDIANQKVRELEQALLTASENGRWPVLCDQSPCLHRMRNHIASLHLYEPGEFIHDFLAPHLSFHPIDTPVALHLTCSTRHMHVEAKLIDLAKMCATKVIVPDEVGCCGFAGDKGFTHPDINKYALRKLSPTLHSHGVAAGYSNSRTCEIGLTSNTGIPYKSITYLVDDCTTPLTDIK
jgi:D-lactate dehydrogenase